MCVSIVWYPREFSRLYNLHPLYWNSLLCGLISSGENSAYFLQLMPFTILQFLFHKVPITTGWAEVVYNETFAWQSYRWQTMGIEPHTFWSWVQHPIHWATCSVQLNWTNSSCSWYYSALILYILIWLLCCSCSGLFFRCLGFFKI